MRRLREQLRALWAKSDEDAFRIEREWSDGRAPDVLFAMTWRWFALTLAVEAFVIAALLHD